MTTIMMANRRQGSAALVVLLICCIGKQISRVLMGVDRGVWETEAAQKLRLQQRRVLALQGAGEAQQAHQRSPGRSPKLLLLH